jgi:hypothetical protein
LRKFRSNILIMASEKINEINEKIESGREAVKGAIS